jgi:hypothetical protein
MESRWPGGFRRLILSVELAAARGSSAGRRGLVERRDGRLVVGLFLF